MLSLPEPKIVECHIEGLHIHPRVPAMGLTWQGSGFDDERRDWSLPTGVTFQGPLPVNFGIYIQRQDEDCYAVHLVWDQMHLSWKALRRWQLVQSCLPALLEAIGTDLRYLLDQPVQLEVTKEVDGRGLQLAGVS